MKRKKLLLIGGSLVAFAVLGVLAVIVIFALRSDDANLLTEAPTIPAGSTSGAGGTPSSSDANLPEGTFHFVIDQSGSEAKYVVRETLRGIVGAQAVGTTNAVTGDLYLTKDGLYKDKQSKFSVDLTKLRTDESLRDNYVRSNVLQTNRFPTAEFIAETITPWPADYVDGTQVALKLGGTLTIHGVSKKVEWAVSARRAGDALTGIADIDFNMTDFGMQPPDVPTAKAENGVHLQMTIVARRAS